MEVKCIEMKGKEWVQWKSKGKKTSKIEKKKKRRENKNLEIAEKEPSLCIGDSSLVLCVVNSLVCCYYYMCVCVCGVCNVTVRKDLWGLCLSPATPPCVTLRICISPYLNFKIFIFISPFHKYFYILVLIQYT